MNEPLKDILIDVAEKRIDADEGVRRVQRLVQAIEDAKRTDTVPMPMPYPVPYEPVRPYNPCEPQWPWWPYITWTGTSTHTEPVSIAYGIAPDAETQRLLDIAVDCQHTNPYGSVDAWAAALARGVMDAGD